MKKLIVSLAVTVLVVGLSVGGALAKSEKQSATVAGVRPAAGHEVVGPVGDAGPADVHRGLQEGQHPGDGRERRG